ncbi:MAG: hypothetical protein JST36_11505 [Bacteroidetes bacterium]|nr:hypothetical protein [Bacteroidota bacterium]
MKLTNRNKISLALVLLLCSTATIHAQNENDALRFSFLQPQGTARSIGIGSALGSIGGDFSSLAVNPAGIGIYRSSEMMITPSLSFTNSQSNYTGNAMDDQGSHFAISNLGLVTTKVTRGRSARSGWTTISFGMGLTRLADFTRNYSYQGRNTTSSGSFVFEADANKNGLTNNTQPNTQGDLAYDTYLINPTTNNPNQYLSVVNPTASSPISQTNTVQERGGISELGFSLGGSYENRLMLGATVGIPFVRFVRNQTYEENDLSGNTNNDFAYFSYSDELKTTGTGINLKLGAIFKANDYLRFGVAFHTPSYISLHDQENRSLNVNTENLHGSTSSNAMENQYDYSLSTPYRALLSGTVLFGKYGFLTADYEYVDYSSSRFSFGNTADERSYQNEINNNIKTQFTGASNIRTGLEIRLDNFFLRGGFGYYGNPYKNSNTGSERLDFSGGLGFRFQHSYIDFGFVHRQFQNEEQPYNLPDTDLPGSLYYNLIVPTATIQTSTNNAVVTFGVKF